MGWISRLRTSSENTRWGWKPLHRAAVVINHRMWPGVVTAVAKEQIAVLADNGVHQWHPRGDVWPVEWAADFAMGRRIALDAKAAGHDLLAQKEQALKLRREAQQLFADEMALRRG